MEYNSQKSLLVMPEYGRNLQQLVEYAKEIEDPEKHQAFVDKIVELMQQMHPQNRNLDEYNLKLWKHVYKIANYQLKAIPPDGEIPTPESEDKHPEKIGYPQSTAKFRHYGSNVQRLISKALSMEDGPVKQGFVSVIGGYMKLAYQTWNKEHYVSDEVIKGDLETLSGGDLELDENASIDKLSQSNRKRKRSGNGKSSRSKNKRKK